MCARNDAKCFTTVSTGRTLGFRHNHYPYLYKWEKWRTERGDNLSAITQVMRGWAWSRNQGMRCYIRTLSHEVILTVTPAVRKLNEHVGECTWGLAIIFSCITVLLVLFHFCHYAHNWFMTSIAKSSRTNAGQSQRNARLLWGYHPEVVLSLLLSLQIVLNCVTHQWVNCAVSSSFRMIWSTADLLRKQADIS